MLDKQRYQERTIVNMSVHLQEKISSFRVLGLALLLPVLLVACQPTRQTIVVIPEPEPVIEDTSLQDEAAARAHFEEQLRYQRMIADILYEGRKALNANRLMTPPEISAHAYFQRVLAIEPDNAVALQGIQDIASKYLQLAEEAGGQGLYDEAKGYLRRAEQVDRNHVGIAPAWVALEAEMETTDVVHSLSASELNSKSAAISVQLSRIAIQARDAGAFFLITAPSDDQARWIYTQMQAAVEGYRLRGNIELGSTPTIRLIMPVDEDA
ncbi:MAG: hypothetical protein V4751_08075 [Pseudomonadota bacterium]